MYSSEDWAWSLNSYFSVDEFFTKFIPQKSLFLPKNTVSVYRISKRNLDGYRLMIEGRYSLLSTDKVSAREWRYGLRRIDDFTPLASNVRCYIDYATAATEAWYCNQELFIKTRLPRPSPEVINSCLPLLVSKQLYLKNLDPCLCRLFDIINTKTAYVPVSLDGVNRLRNYTDLDISADTAELIGKIILWYRGEIRYCKQIWEKALDTYDLDVPKTVRDKVVPFLDSHKYFEYF